MAWDDDAADQFAIIAAELDSIGKRIGTFDTMIAAHALAANCIAFTNNIEHFSRVSGLTVQSWN